MYKNLIGGVISPEIERVALAHSILSYERYADTFIEMLWWTFKDNERMIGYLEMLIEEKERKANEPDPVYCPGGQVVDVERRWVPYCCCCGRCG